MIAKGQALICTFRLSASTKRAAGGLPDGTHRDLSPPPFSRKREASDGSPGAKLVIIFPSAARNPSAKISRTCNPLKFIVQCSHSPCIFGAPPSPYISERWQRSAWHVTERELKRPRGVATVGIASTRFGAQNSPLTREAMARIRNQKQDSSAKPSRQKKSTPKAKPAEDSGDENLVTEAHETNDVSVCAYVHPFSSSSLLK